MDNPHDWRSIRCYACGLVHYVPVYCGDRFCPVCNRSRRTRIRSRLQDLIKKTQLKNNENFRHMVLTIKSRENPGEMCRYLVKSFRKFRQSKIFKRNFSGGAFVIEITHSDAGYHVHLHICLQGMYADQCKLLESWRKSAGRAGLFIKTIPKDSIIKYLTKYMTKGTIEGEAKDLELKALRGLRLFTCFGSWHDLLPQWTKIPFVCPDCGGLEWQPFDKIDQADEEKLETIFNQRYLCWWED